MLLCALFCVSLVCFVGVLVVLIWDFRGFREFATHPGPEGTASLGDWISIRGSVVVLLTLAIIVGVLSPLLTLLLEQNDGDEIVGLEIEDLRLEIVTLEGDIRELEAKMKDLGTPEGILRTVAKLKRDVHLTNRLVEMAEKQKGPWSLPGSEELTASIPGEIEAGSAAACSKHHERYLQIVGPQMGRTVTVHVKTLIYQASDCSDRISFDLKLSCPDAFHIFGESILTCSGLQPLWTDGKTRHLAVHAVEVKTPGS